MHHKNFNRQILLLTTALLFTLNLIPVSASPSLMNFRAPSAQISKESQQPVFKELPGQKKKCWVDENTYFLYEFTEKPRMGTAILRIQVMDKKGEKLSSFKILGRYDMLSMAGAHDSGEQQFKLNKKNDYLLPVNLVMPGEWEVKLTFLKDDLPVFRGRFKFDV